MSTTDDVQPTTTQLLRWGGDDPSALCPRGCGHGTARHDPRTGVCLRCAAEGLSDMAETPCGDWLRDASEHAPGCDTEPGGAQAATVQPSGAISRGATPQPLPLEGLLEPSPETFAALGLSASTRTGGEPPPAEMADLDELTGYVLRKKVQVAQSGMLHLWRCVELGHALLEAKRRVPHGAWMTWLGDEARIQIDRAENFMTLARNSERVRNLLDLQPDLSARAALAIIRALVQTEKRAARDSSPRKQAGQPPLFEDERVQVWQADAADTGLPDGDGLEIWEAPSLITFSPPYHVGLTYETVEDESWEEYQERVRGWCAELWRISTDGTRVACNVANNIWDQQAERPRDLEHVWKRELYAAGFEHRFTVDWTDGNGHRNGATGFGSLDSAAAPNVINPVERVIVVHKGAWNRTREHRESDIDHETFMACHHGVWNIAGAKRTTGHPAPQPTELLRRLVLLLTFPTDDRYPADVVYDPFSGEGTAAVTAYKLGRRAWASDVWPDAVGWTQEALSKAVQP